jgi:translation initiation factor IF-1
MSVKATKPRSSTPRARKRPRAKPAVSLLPSGIAEGVVVRVREDGTAQVRLEDGSRLDARLPQHVNAAWLEEAVRVAPVEAAVALTSRGRALLWCLFPGPEHAAVVVDLELTGRTVTLRAEERVELQCSRARVELNQEGDVTVKGREVLSRATSVNRIKGGTIRLN